jgi:acyl-CoA dehydrogenase
MATDLTAARLLVYRAAWERIGRRRASRSRRRWPRRSPPRRRSASWTTRCRSWAGRGVLAEHPVDRLYRSVRALRIYEGTTEIQHLIIAGQLLK